MRVKQDYQHRGNWSILRNSYLIAQILQEFLAMNSLTQ